MKTPHDKFCALPWISLEASPLGTVRPCCLAEEEIVDSHGVKFNLNQANLKDVQNSEYMYQLRKSFLRGDQHITCRKCWNEEAAGRTSKRMHTLDRLKHIVKDTEWTPEPKPLLFLDLKLGNICNLRCRICGPWSSSSYAVEELSQDASTNKKHSDVYLMLQQGRWPRENSNFWNQIDGMLDQIRYIEFTGGEPFMISEHFDMLQKIVDRGIANQVEIHYNTNGTQYPENAEAIWQHFRHVEIAFSIDDVGARFEYQRTGAVWSDVQRNIALFQDMRHRNPNMSLQVCSTVNVYNVMYLEELANWIDRQGFDFIYWNMLHEAAQYSIGTLPAMIKRAVDEKLRSSQVSEWHRQQFDSIIEFMHRSPGMDPDILLASIATLDQRRAHDLRRDHAELANLLGYKGPNE